VFEGLLSPLGYVVTPALDGEEALQIVRSREYLPDVVLLDVQMPGKTGYEVILAICSIDRMPPNRFFSTQVCADLRKEFPDGLPIIMISANTDEASILQGLQVFSHSV
jgi:CheY-like chemotaxis protein